MTWDVIQASTGELQLIPHGDPVPAGWTVVAETANPDYLNQVTPRVLTKYEARLRFTFNERAAIDTSSDVGVIVFRNDFNSASEIDLDSQGLVDGLAYLESLGLLAAGRADEIRA
jgi:hypothetical protein